MEQVSDWKNAVSFYGRIGIDAERVKGKTWEEVEPLLDFEIRAMKHDLRKVWLREGLIRDKA